MNTEREIVTEIMRRFGTRVSETLRIRYEELIENSKIFIRGSKGSHDRILYAPDIVNAIHSVCGIKSEGDIFSVSEGDIYRFCLEQGIAMNGKKRRRVTSAHRHRAVLEKVASGFSVEQIQNFIGHKKKKTTEYYIGQWAQH